MTGRKRPIGDTHQNTQSVHFGRTLRTQTKIIDAIAIAAAAALPGTAIGSLVEIIDAIARTTSHLCAALRTQTKIIDAVAIAAAAALPGTAIGSLVEIIDAIARTISHLCTALRTQTKIIDAVAIAAPAALLGTAIGSLVKIIDAVATGKRVTAEHQQHRKNQFHFTLPWACQETAWRWVILFQQTSRHAIKLTSLKEKVPEAD